MPIGELTPEWSGLLILPSQYFLAKKGADTLNTLLWILQVLLAVFTAFTGVTHFLLPPDLPAPLQWMYALPTPLHYSPARRDHGSLSDARFN
jgi:hypothetical protein